MIRKASTLKQVFQTVAISMLAALYLHAAWAGSPSYPLYESAELLVGNGPS